MPPTLGQARVGHASVERLRAASGTPEAEAEVAAKGEGFTAPSTVLSNPDHIDPAAAAELRRLREAGPPEGWPQVTTRSPLTALPLMATDCQ